LIENVWNRFCETPDELRDYIDEIESPWVGVYFDIGNAGKFAPSQQWIRTLGSRIVKLDIKGWGVEEGFCKIGDGDVEWPEVSEAHVEIGYIDWSAGEVHDGQRQMSAHIARRMCQLLSLV